MDPSSDTPVKKPAPVSFNAETMAAFIGIDETYKGTLHEKKADPYGANEWDLLKVIAHAKALFYDQTDRMSAPARLYLGYYERRALEKIMRSTPSRFEERESGKRLRWEDMEVFSVDAYSHCDVT